MNQFEFREDPAIQLEILLILPQQLRNNSIGLHFDFYTKIQFNFGRSLNVIQLKLDSLSRRSAFCRHFNNLRVERECVY